MNLFLQDFVMIISAVTHEHAQHYENLIFLNLDFYTCPYIASKRLANNTDLPRLLGNSLTSL